MAYRPQLSQWDTFAARVVFEVNVASSGDSYATEVVCVVVAPAPKPSSVKPTKAYSRGSVVMVDEIMNASPSKFRFPEAGLRVMVTSHFGPKTRLRMASRLIITEVRSKKWEIPRH